MARRPKADHNAARETEQHLGPAARETKDYAHTLSLRLTAAQYLSLRQHVIAQEQQSGKRITHQAIIETALTEWLSKNV